ncbi:MAG: hypothetical protein JWP40_2391, partial [Blastococcus sp.]|nr:hypothetical protein [Blastococcus sp.]
MHSFVSGGSVRHAGRVVAYTAVVGLLASGLVTIDAVASPVTQPAAASPAQAHTPLTRPDLMSAALTARSSGQRVEIVAAEDALSTTYANPDGTLTTESHAAPIRFKDAHGKWQPVDLTLQQNADGSI